jgi:hypothetical protein
LSERLQDKAFLSKVADALTRHSQVIDFPVVDVDVEERIKKLERKREHIVEDFWEERISKELRDRALAGVEADLAQLMSLNTQQKGLQPVLEAQRLAGVFRVFRRFKRLGRDDKRLLLKGSQCQIEVSGYTIKSLNLTGIPIGSNKGSEVPEAGA